MDLETLIDVKEIGGFKLTEPGHGITNKEWEEYDKSHPICINHEKNRISFRIQNVPIKEVGINVCQVDTIIHAAKKILEGLDAKFPS